MMVTWDRMMGRVLELFKAIKTGSRVAEEMASRIMIEEREEGVSKNYKREVAVKMDGVPGLGHSGLPELCYMYKALVNKCAPIWWILYERWQ